MHSGSNTVNIPPWRRALRRFSDVILSLAAIIILSPLILYVAIRVLISSKGPVLYSQERVGYKGNIFRILKFRSMYENAELSGPQLSVANDPRITPWGRIMRRRKLDELPQLLNVLRGDMSVVGPRPERPYYIRMIAEITTDYAPLLEIKPGITSLGMVKFGYAASVDEMISRMKYDLVYLNNRSLRMDVAIIAGTLRIIFTGKGR